MLQPLQDPSKRFFDQVVITPSYLIFKIGDIVYAKNGLTGQIEFSGTDAGKVIQLAIDSLGAGEIFIKAATYIITSSLKPKSGQSIIGEGYGTLLQVPADFTDEIRVLHLLNVTDVKVEGLRIDMQKTVPTAPVQHPVELYNASRCIIRNVWAERAGHTGINLYAGSWGNVISKCIARLNRHFGLYLDACPNNVIEGCVFEGNAWGGIALRSTGGHYNIVSNNISRWNRGPGIYIYTNAHKNLIIGNSVCLNYTHGIYVYATSHNNLIVGNYVADNSTDASNVYDGIRIENVNNAHVVANSVRGSHRYGIAVESGNNNVVIFNDIRSSGLSGALRDAGTDTVKKGNLGFITENSGAATIAAGATYVDVAHGLAITPDINKIKITPKDNLGGRSFWVSDVGATTFRINISLTDTVDHVFGWSYE